MNLFISQENYKILIKEKFKIILIIIFYLLILFCVIYLIYSKTQFSTKISIVEKPNLSLVHNYNNIYNKMNLFTPNKNIFFYEIFYENFHSEIVNNKSLIENSLNSLKTKFNLDIEVKKILNKIFIDQRTVELIGPKRIFEGKKYIEIYMDRNTFKKLDFYDEKIYNYFLNNILLETNKIIFSKFNNSVSKQINLINTAIIQNKIRESKIKFNNELDKIIHDTKNELDLIIEHLNQKYPFLRNDNTSPLIQLLLYFDENYKNKNYIINISSMNFFYTYFLLEELKNIDKFNAGDDNLDDTFLLFENIKDILNNIQLKNISFLNSISYTLFRNIKLSKLIQLNKKIISLDNNLKQMNYNKTNFICNEECFLKYTINNKFEKNFIKDITNFYILILFVLSIFIVSLYLTLYLLILFKKIKSFS